MHMSTYVHTNTIIKIKYIDGHCFTFIHSFIKVIKMYLLDFIPKPITSETIA